MQNNTRVLLVDDETDIASVLARGLKDLGYKVGVFNRPRDVLEQDLRQYDIAVLDIRMPQMNGFELARRIWAINENLLICFLSAFEIHGREAMRTLPSLKSYCFLTKPITARELAKHVESHLRDRSVPATTQ